MTDSNSEVMAVVETRLSHNLHRLATALLADAALRPTVPLVALVELRDFLVANLRHHHEAEDERLWPLVSAVAPAAADGLIELGAEHERLDSALDALNAVPVAQDGDRPALHAAAVAVRDLIHVHLGHEEPLLFPVLRDDLPPEAWAVFSQHVIATSPPIAPHLLIGFFVEAGTAEEFELMLSGLPEPLQELVPVLREQGRSALAVLAGTDPVS
jgi:hemerythrin-like domain-containing protein